MLKEVHEAGYAVVIVSNQAINSTALKKWKRKISLIAAALPDVPFRLYAATAKDSYRKPMPGIWYEIERAARMDGIEIDKSSSFFVGDAAGRQFQKGKGDFASTDRKWSLNVGIKFYTPEEYFLRLPAHQNTVLPGFHVSSLPDCTISIKYKYRSTDVRPSTIIYAYIPAFVTDLWVRNCVVCGISMSWKIEFFPSLF